MGDGITTTFDVLMFIAILVGVPALIFALPIAVLVALSIRRSKRTQQ